MIGFKRPCMLCGKFSEMQFTGEEMHKYITEYRNGGKTIQSVFPDMPANKREFLITGMCPECQAEMFGPQK